MATQADDENLRTLLSTTIACDSTVPMDQDADGDKTLGFTLQAQTDAKAAPVPKDERFELIRPHKQGGIGQVWLARDSELQREVAVKEIQPRYAEREDYRSRFVLEAEITGSLEHPGIVPVYSLGRDAKGRPYYAMRFIKARALRWRSSGFTRSLESHSGTQTRREPEHKTGRRKTRRRQSRSLPARRTGIRPQRSGPSGGSSSGN